MSGLLRCSFHTFHYRRDGALIFLQVNPRDGRGERLGLEGLIPSVGQLIEVALALVPCLGLEPVHLREDLLDLIEQPASNPASAEIGMHVEPAQIGGAVHCVTADGTDDLPIDYRLHEDDSVRTGYAAILGAASTEHGAFALRHPLEVVLQVLERLLECWEA